MQPPSYFKARTLWPSLPPFLKYFFSSPIFCSTTLKGILDSSPHLHTTPSSPNLTPTLFTMITKLKQISIALFYHLKSHFSSKFNFWVLKSLYKYIRLFYYMGILRFIFSQLRMTFVNKVMVAETNNFSSNVQHSFTKRKAISKFKNYKSLKN